MSTPGQLYVSLHTAEPTAQAPSEVVYTHYARVAVVRKPSTPATGFFTFHGPTGGVWSATPMLARYTSKQVKRQWHRSGSKDTLRAWAAVMAPWDNRLQLWLDRRPLHHGPARGAHAARPPSRKAKAREARQAAKVANFSTMYGGK